MNTKRYDAKINAQISLPLQRASTSSGQSWLGRLVKSSFALLAVTNRNHVAAALQVPTRDGALSESHNSSSSVFAHILMGRTDVPNMWGDGESFEGTLFDGFTVPFALKADGDPMGDRSVSVQCVPDGTTYQRPYPSGMFLSTIRGFPLEAQSLVGGNRWYTWSVDSCGRKRWLSDDAPVTLRIGFDLSQLTQDWRIDADEVFSALSSAQQEHVKNIIRKFTDISNLSFVFVKEGERADIVYRISDLLSCNGYCLAGYTFDPRVQIPLPFPITVMKQFFDIDYVHEHEGQHAFFGASHTFSGSETKVKLPLKVNGKTIADNMLASKMSYTAEPRVPDGTAPIDAAAQVYTYGTARAFIGDTIHTVGPDDGLNSVCDRSGRNTLHVVHPGREVHADIGSQPATFRVTVVGKSRFQLGPGCDFDVANITESGKGTIIDNGRNNILVGSANGHTIVTSRGGQDRVYLHRGNNVVVVEQVTDLVRVYGFQADTDRIGVAQNITNSPWVSLVEEGTQIDFAESGPSVIIMGQSLTAAQVNRTIVGDFVVHEPGYAALLKEGEYFPLPSAHKGPLEIFKDPYFVTLVGVSACLVVLVGAAGCSRYKTVGAAAIVPDDDGAVQIV